MSTKKLKNYTHSFEEINPKWFLVDAKKHIVGRLATQVASLLAGKDNERYTPNLFSGNYVIIINASHVQFTKKKWETKKYYHHSGYPGGLKTRLAKDIHEKDPTKIIELAIKGMLPKTKLGSKMFQHLYIYPDNNYPHQGQKPIVVNLAN